MRGDLSSLSIMDVSESEIQKILEAGISYTVDRDPDGIDLFFENKEDYLEAMVTIGEMEKVAI